jgi:hypothetical protein
MTETTTVANPLAYPQTKLRITATYRAGTAGDVVPEGQPETVEIELNELPETGLAEFVTELVDSLFREFAVTVEQAGDPAQVTG